MLTKEQIDERKADIAYFEKALDSGRVEIAMVGGNWWKARRNGKTRRWVTDPMRFEIPMKVGLKRFMTFDNSWLADEGRFYRIKPEEA